MTFPEVPFIAYSQHEGCDAIFYHVNELDERNAYRDGEGDIICSAKSAQQYLHLVCTIEQLKQAFPEAFI